MTLRLTIENVPSLSSGDPVVKELDGHGLVIGRAGHVDWTLPDPQALISSVHCEIDFNDGGYWLTDRSTNGTFVNGTSERLTAHSTRHLVDWKSLAWCYTNPSPQRLVCFWGLMSFPPAKADRTIQSSTGLKVGAAGK